MLGTAVAEELDVASRPWTWPFCGFDDCGERLICDRPGDFIGVLCSELIASLGE